MSRKRTLDELLLDAVKFMNWPTGSITTAEIELPDDFRMKIEESSSSTSPAPSEKSETIKPKKPSKVRHGAVDELLRDAVTFNQWPSGSNREKTPVINANESESVDRRKKKNDSKSSKQELTPTMAKFKKVKSPNQSKREIDELLQDAINFMDWPTSSEPTNAVLELPDSFVPSLSGDESDQSDESPDHSDLTKQKKKSTESAPLERVRKNSVNDQMKKQRKLEKRKEKEQRRIDKDARKRETSRPTQEADTNPVPPKSNSSFSWNVSAPPPLKHPTVSSVSINKPIKPQPRLDLLSLIQQTTVEPRSQIVGPVIHAEAVVMAAASIIDGPSIRSEALLQHQTQQANIQPAKVPNKPSVHLQPTLTLFAQLEALNNLIAMSKSTQIVNEDSINEEQNIVATSAIGHLSNDLEPVELPVVVVQSSSSGFSYRTCQETENAPVNVFDSKATQDEVNADLSTVVKPVASHRTFEKNHHRTFHHNHKFKRYDSRYRRDSKYDNRPYGTVASNRNDSQESPAHPIIRVLNASNWLHLPKTELSR